MMQLIGHRGASGYAPENTIVAFEKAREKGCNFIEFDVMLSSDGIPFIFHDESIKRTTNGRGKFGLLPSDYLQTLDAGRWYSRKFKGEKIPTLAEAIEWLNNNNMHANIEIKPYPGTTDETTIALLTQINRYWPSEKNLPLISSFELNALTLTRSLSPEIPIGFLMHKWQENWLQIAKDLNCYSIHLNCKIAKPSRIEAIIQEGYKVYVYTINSKRKAKKLSALGVEAIFSDYPDLLL